MKKWYIVAIAAFFLAPLSASAMTDTRQDTITPSEYEGMFDSKTERVRFKRGGGKGF